MIMNHQPCDDSHSSCSGRDICLACLNYSRASDEHHQGEHGLKSCDD